MSPGVYIFHFAPPPGAGGGTKIWVFGWLGKKYDDLLGKKANIRGKKVKKNWKKGKFSLYLGKKYDFRKRRGGGQKYPIFGKYITLGESLYKKKKNLSWRIVAEAVTSILHSFHSYHCWQGGGIFWTEGCIKLHKLHDWWETSYCLLILPRE